MRRRRYDGIKNGHTRINTCSSTAKPHILKNPTRTIQLSHPPPPPPPPSSTTTPKLPLTPPAIPPPHHHPSRPHLPHLPQAKNPIHVPAARDGAQILLDGGVQLKTDAAAGVRRCCGCGAR